MNRPSSLPTDAPRMSAGEIAANLGLALVAIIICYLVVVGAIATAISQGWSA